VFMSSVSFWLMFTRAVFLNKKAGCKAELARILEREVFALLQKKRLPGPGCRPGWKRSALINLLESMEER
jgi:hypothetical protein